MNDIDTVVRKLLNDWRAETVFESSISRMRHHPAFRELAALGLPALPGLLADLAREPTVHVPLALYAITGANPVPTKHAGRVKLIAEDWLRWGRENGYVVSP